jgi:hypothetical protein
MACALQIDRNTWEELAEQMRNENTGVAIQTRKSGFRRYYNVFLGSDAVTWLVSNNFAKSRSEGTEIGNYLLDHDIIHHVTFSHKFKDSNLLYRFTADESISKRLENKGPSAPSVTTSCGTTKFGPILKKGFLFWNQKFAIVKQDEAKFFVYETELDPSPSYEISLEDNVTVKEMPDAKKNHYCFLIVTPDDTLLLACSSSKEQESWLAALLDAGANFQQESGNDITQNTIYEFTCKDINNQDVSLSSYAGQVCLIVNVASK